MQWNGELFRCSERWFHDCSSCMLKAAGCPIDKLFDHVCYPCHNYHNCTGPCFFQMFSMFRAARAQISSPMLSPCPSRPGGDRSQSRARAPRWSGGTIPARVHRTLAPWCRRPQLTLVPWDVFLGCNEWDIHKYTVYIWLMVWNKSHELKDGR